MIRDSDSLTCLCSCWHCSVRQTTQCPCSSPPRLRMPQHHQMLMFLSSLPLRKLRIPSKLALEHQKALYLQAPCYFVQMRLWMET